MISRSYCAVCTLLAPSIDPEWRACSRMLQLALHGASDSIGRLSSRCTRRSLRTYAAHTPLPRLRTAVVGFVTHAKQRARLVSRALCAARFAANTQRAGIAPSAARGRRRKLSCLPPPPPPPLELTRVCATVAVDVASLMSFAHRIRAYPQAPGGIPVPSPPPARPRPVNRSPHLFLRSPETPMHACKLTTHDIRAYNRAHAQPAACNAFS